nr:hypothetical protein [Pandoravirus massiliensis]
MLKNPSARLFGLYTSLCRAGCARLQTVCLFFSGHFMLFSFITALRPAQPHSAMGRRETPQQNNAMVISAFFLINLFSCMIPPFTRHHQKTTYWPMFGKKSSPQCPPFDIRFFCPFLLFSVGCPGTNGFATGSLLLCCRQAREKCKYKTVGEKGFSRLTFFLRQ